MGRECPFPSPLPSAVPQARGNIEGTEKKHEMYRISGMPLLPCSLRVVVVVGVHQPRGLLVKYHHYAYSVFTDLVTWGVGRTPEGLSLLLPGDNLLIGCDGWEV